VNAAKAMPSLPTTLCEPPRCMLVTARNGALMEVITSDPASIDLRVRTIRAIMCAARGSITCAGPI
jgi:hypothetical protein